MSQTEITTENASGEEVPARVEKRRSDSRRKLLDAARTLFAEKGYHATRSQDISKAAGVGHGTFYLYFKDKRECFLAFVDEARAALQADIDAAITGMPYGEERTFTVLKAIVNFSRKDENLGVIRAAMMDSDVIDPRETKEASLLDRWGQYWTKAVAEEISQNGMEPDMDVRLIGHAVAGAVVQVTRSIGKLKDGNNVDEILRNLSKLITRLAGQSTK